MKEYVIKRRTSSKTDEKVNSCDIMRLVIQQEIPKTEYDWPGDGSSGRYVSDFEPGPKIDQ